MTMTTGHYRRADSARYRLRIDHIHADLGGVIVTDVNWQKAVPGVPGGWVHADVERYVVVERCWVGTVGP